MGGLQGGERGTTIHCKAKARFNSNKATEHENRVVAWKTNMACVTHTTLHKIGEL